MRWMTILLFVALSAAAAPKTKVSAGGDKSARPPFSVALRGGFMLRNPDAAVVRRWEHKAVESFQIALSGFYSFPQAWKQIYFFAGPEFAFQNVTEELSGSGYTASINISIYRFFLTGGVAYQPYWAGGDWGASLATALEVWGQKTATLDSQGFTQDLGTESTGARNSSVPLNLNGIFAIYYDLGYFRPQLIFESNSTIGLGAAYAF